MEGVQYATGEKQRAITNSSRKNEAAGPKQKQHSVVDMFVNKIEDIKGTFHTRMGMIKDRNSKDLREAEEIKKRWQGYTELYKKGLNDPDNRNGMVICLEPDTLEREVKWALGDITMNKANGGDKILRKNIKKNKKLRKNIKKLLNTYPSTPGMWN